MNGELGHNESCSCELCQPNWRLGVDGEFEVIPPQQQRVESENLLEAHLRKLREAGLNLASVSMG